MVVLSLTPCGLLQPALRDLARTDDVRYLMLPVLKFTSRSCLATSEDPRMIERELRHMVTPFCVTQHCIYVSEGKVPGMRRVASSVLSLRVDGAPAGPDLLHGSHVSVYTRCDRLYNPSVQHDAPSVYLVVGVVNLSRDVSLCQ